MSFLFFLLLALGSSDQGEDPRLIVVITVDQLRAGDAERMAGRLPEGGFRRLLGKGKVFTEARFRHSTTFTGCGHATIATGASPSDHGIVGNNWIDPETGKTVYCVEGKSAGLMLSPTLGDLLIESTKGSSRVFGVAVKDRGALLTAGQKGKAFWFSSKTGTFESKSYAGGKLPIWAQAWNARKWADSFAKKSWDLLLPASQYQFEDARKVERPYRKLGNTFPHPLPGKEEEGFYSTLKYTPIGDELTLGFTLALLEGEKLGSRKGADLLFLGFSSTDYVGHRYGPASREAEDNLFRLDRLLADFFRALEQSVGWNRTLIVLTSDHGVDRTPETVPGVGRLQPKEFLQAVNDSLKTQFGLEEPVAHTFLNPCIYLEQEMLENKGIGIAAAEKVAARTLEKWPGIQRVFTRTELAAAKPKPGTLESMVKRSFHPERSGHLFLIQEPGWYLNPDPEANAAMHGSPHDYDTHVPVIFFGAGVNAGKVDRRIGPEDIAPTLAALLSLKIPGKITGQALPEILPASEKF